MAVTETAPVLGADTAPEPDKRRYVCPGCGKRRKLRSFWGDFNAFVSVTDESIYCWRCADAPNGYVRLERCELCGTGRLSRFYVDTGGLIHRDYRCLMGEALTVPLKGTIRIHTPVLRESVTGLPIRGPVSKLTDKAAVTRPKPPSLARRDTAPPRTAPRRPEPKPITGDTRNCEKCGEPFVPARSDARFCSAKCRVAAHRAKA